jgi:hypothetical protein
LQLLVGEKNIGELRQRKEGMKGNHYGFTDDWDTNVFQALRSLMRGRSGAWRRHWRRLVRYVANRPPFEPNDCWL